MTNYERLKAMSVEELVRFHTEECRRIPYCTLDCEGVEGECPKCIKEWLEREVQDEAD